MARSLPLSGSRLRSRAASGLTLIGLLSLGLFASMAGSADAAATAVPLGTAKSFAVLAGAGITNTGATRVTGDVGTFPTTSMTGTGSLTINGTNHHGDAVTQSAKSALVTAYNTAAGEGPHIAIAANLGGRTLTRGVYHSGSSIGLTGTLTLNAAGDPDAVFVFQAGSTLTTASASQVRLVNGAQPCNVFWQVGSSATLGTGSTFRGTLMALTSITVTTGTTIEGRVLARNGAVTLHTDTITRPACAAASTVSPSASASPTATPPPTGTSSSTTPAGSATPTSSSQVTRRPVGSVDTGDTGTGGSTGGLVRLAGGLVIVAVIGTVVAVGLHRRRA